MFGIGGFYETQAYEDFDSDRNSEWRGRSYSRKHTGYSPKTYVCKYCGQAEMRWVLIEGKYRMKDREGNVHSCLYTEIG